MRKAITLLSFMIIPYAALLSKTIYLAPDGSDANPGTLEAPYGSIAKAASQLFAGDTLIIREGRYADMLQLPRSGTAADPIVVMAYPGERVVLTALEPLSGWELDEGSVYKTSVSWDLGQWNFVMHGDTACDLARWPNNTDENVFSLNSLRNTGGSAGDVIYNAYLDYSGGIPDYDWSKGGSIFFYGDKGGAGWIAWKSFIKSNSSTRLTFDLNKNPDWIRTWHAPADLGDFYLEGIREAIDYQNEWFFDEATKTLYLQLPGGIAPADSAVYMRKRIQAIKLNQNYVVIKNLEVFGGSVDITGSNNHLYGIRSRWGNHHRGIMTGFSAGAHSFHVQGANNLVEKCDIGFSAATGVKLSGTKNKLINNYIHNFNFLGSYDAPVMARDGSSSTISHNTITRGGRDAVHASNNYSVISYNDVSRSNLIADDCALFYCTSGPHYITIHHNWFHDTWSRGKLKKAAGIYLDSSPKGFTVHHNVVWNTEWSSIQMNKDARDINIFNNTLWDASTAIGTWHADGTQFERVVVYNNLANNPGWDTQTDYQNNLTVYSDPFVNSSEKNWQLKPGTQPVDFGRHIEGFTEGYLGDNPDAGAYEHGAPFWKAGIDWDPSLGPDVCLEEDVYEEVDGVVVIEAESVAGTGKGWLVSSEIPSLGDAYMEYAGADAPSEVADSTISEYRVKISHPGTYRFLWLSRSGLGASETDMQNSSWVHIGCDEFYGSGDGEMKTIDTAFVALSSPLTEEWSWESSASYEDSDSLALYARFNYSGTYSIRIAGSLQGHLIDRLVLYQVGRDVIATDSLMHESHTGCDEYSVPDPWATPVQVEAFFQEEEIVVDGVMEEAWEFLSEIEAKHSMKDTELPAETDLSAGLRIAFNDSALFLYGTIQDDMLSDESLDLFFNPDNRHQTLGLYGADALHIRLFYGADDSLYIGNGSWKHSDFSGFECVSLPTENGYVLEARIPWKGIYPLEFAEKSTTHMGFEFQVNDTDGTKTELFLAWANNTGVDLAMYDTRKLGVLSLIKDEELEPVRVSGVDIPEDTILIELGEIYRMQAEVLPENADNKTITWQTSDAFVLSLQPSTGVAKGLYPGTALVRVTTQEGGFTDTCVLVVPDPNATSVEDQLWVDQDQREIRLLPNPATSSFRISGPGSVSELRLFNMTGELMLHLENVNSEEAIQIDQLPTGLYLVKVRKDQHLHQKKLLKLRN